MSIARAMIATVLALGTIAPVMAQDRSPSFSRPTYDTDGQSVDSIAVFFEPLAHYGRWLDTRFGRAWAPAVGRDWRPYTIGHWDAGPYGPTWRSDEPFGWAVFHFGRWAYDPAVGWVWLPDTVWGPGWVAWRDGDDISGWAPLPPQVDAFVAGNAGNAGFNDWGYDQWYQPGWVYVPRYALYGRSLRGAYLPTGRGRDLWDHTHGVTRYDHVGGQVVNRSLGDSRSGDRRAEVRTTQTYAASPREVPAAINGDAGGGFASLPRGYGDGFVPGMPRGADRRSILPTAPATRPAVPLARPVPLPAPRSVPPVPRLAPRPEEHHR